MWTIDRFEENHAVLVHGDCTKIILRADLPQDAAAGQAVSCDSGQWVVDNAATRRRMMQIDEKMERIRKRARRGQ